MKLLEEINFLQGTSSNESRIHEMWAEIEQEKVEKEREQVRYNQWLEEREAKKLEIERQWRPNYGLNKSPQVVKKPVEPEPDAGTSITTNTTPSPLLTSLLKTSQARTAAPTITNLLTGMSPSQLPSSSSSSSPSLPPLPLIHVPITSSSAQIPVQIPVSQSAPTLVTLLDKKPEPEPETSSAKDEEAELLADFNELIAGSEKFDDEDLMEDINAIIMNPEILEDKAAEPVKDVDAEVTSEEKLKIKQLVEDFAEVETPPVAEVIPVEEPKVELPAPEIVDDKVMVISDESNDGGKKDEMEVETEPEAQALPTEVKEPEVPDVFQVDDSDEDVLFEDAKEHHEEAEVKEPELPEVEVQQQPLPVEEKTDSDDEILETKVTRTSRKKAAESVKSDAPSSSTRSRDHSENDDNPTIRTRSRHSSVISSEPKSTFNFPKEQDHSMWKARWDDCIKDLQKLANFSSIVDNKFFADDSYKSVILCPMNVKIITKNIESNVSTMPGDVKRDFALMCTNIIMLNKKGAKFNENVHQFIKDGMEIIDDKLEVEDAYKSYRKQIKKKA